MQGKAEQQLGGAEQWLGGAERLGLAEWRLGGAERRLDGAGEAVELCGAAELLGVPLTISSYNIFTYNIPISMHQEMQEWVDGIR